MPLSTAELQAAVDAQAARLTHLSLHTGYPASLANELTGGSPAYARKPLSWGAANGSGVATATQVTVDVPPGVTVAAVGFCSALTAGTVRGDVNVTDEAFAAQGQYQYTPTLDGDTT